MAKTASEIVDRALTLIDEVPTTFATAATTETSIRNQALEILPELCRDLIKELPWELKRHLAKDGTTALSVDALNDGESQAPYVKKKVAFRLPSDFWELVSIRLTVWNRNITDYIYINGEEYERQNNPFTRSGKHSPMVALNNTALGGNARLECFSVHNNDAQTVADFQYVSFDNVPNDLTGDDANLWPDELFDEVTKALAAQLHIIKARLDEAQVKAAEIESSLEQHE